MTGRGLFTFSIGYACFAFAIASVFHGGGVDYAVASLDLVISQAIAFKDKAHWFLIFGAGAYFLDRSGWTRERGISLGLAVVACLLFAFAFSTIKSTLPYIVPYWADPAFARLDRWLHFGFEPYQIAHKAADWIKVDWVTTAYSFVWTSVSIFFPVWLILADNDPARVRRFLVLHVLAWIVLGNILACGFMSAGPVYYDRLLGGDSFAELTRLLIASGISESAMGALQLGLWELYIGERMGIGSGISAFPSMHVGAASLVVLYLAERSRYLMCAGLVYWAIIQFLSVYVGYHYAIDGYVSTLVMVLMWIMLRARTRARGRTVSVV